MSKEFILVSPEFGAFRSGEPVAYKIAEDILVNEGTERRVSQYTKHNNHVIYEVVGNTISIRFASHKHFSNEPFVFEFIKVPKREAVDIRKDKEHIEAVNVFKEIIK